MAAFIRGHWARPVIAPSLEPTMKRQITVKLTIDVAKIISAITGLILVLHYVIGNF